MIPESEMILGLLILPEEIRENEEFCQKGKV